MQALGPTQATRRAQWRLPPEATRAEATRQAWTMPATPGGQTTARPEPTQTRQATAEAGASKEARARRTAARRARALALRGRAFSVVPVTRIAAPMKRAAAPART